VEHADKEVKKLLTSSEEGGLILLRVRFDEPDDRGVAEVGESN
jgi:hypothetical protein